MASRNPLPKFPIVLQKQIKESFFSVKDLSSDKVIEYLQRHRRNCLKVVSAYGITGEDQNRPVFEHIPFRWVQPIRDLDIALQIFREYLSGDGSIYLSSKTQSALSSHNAKGPRTRGAGRPCEVDDEEIIAYLKRRDYQNSPDKNSVILDAISHFQTKDESISRTKVRNAAREAGFTRPYNKKVTNNR